MSFVRCCFLGILTLVGARLPAEGTGPLQSSKQELRLLKGGQRATGPAVTEGLRPSPPAIPVQASVPDIAPTIQLSDSAKLEDEQRKRKSERQNWLVNGVAELEKQDQKHTANPPDEKEKFADPNQGESGAQGEPQYLLKLYSEQKKIDDARAGAAKLPQPSRVDPFAPFLQDWLGNSPVRGEFFDEFARKPSGSGDSDRVDTSMAPTRLDSPSVSTLPVSAKSEARPNPYLPPAVASTAGNTPASTTGSASMTVPVAGVPVAPSVPLPFAPPVAPAEVKQPGRKPSPPPLSDDRKYFPQLKKF